MRYTHLSDAPMGESLIQTAMPPTHPRSGLHAFLHGMLSRRVEIVSQATGSGGTQAAPRPTLEDNRLALPMEYWPKQAQGRLCHAAAAHALAHWRHSPCAQELEGLKPLGQRVAQTIEDARAEALLLRDYPGLRAWWLPYHDADAACGLGLNALLARLARALLDPDYRDGNYWVDKGRRLFDAQRDNLEDYRGLRSLASILANDLGQMRVRFEPDDGQYLRYRDDGVWLWAAEVETIAIQSNNSQEDADNLSDSTASGAISEVPAQGDVAQEVEAQYSYPEWDYRLGRERSHWSTVIERAPVLGPLDTALRASVAADRMIWLPHSRTQRTTNPSLIRRRYLQPEGDTLDIDATVELRVALRHGSLPEPNVFTAIRPHPPETSVLILLDLSASTNQYAAALEKRATCQLAVRLDDGYHRVAIHGFNSDGRHKVYYHHFKDFNHRFDGLCQDNLLRAQSGLSTRTGTALRHAAEYIHTELPRRLKILLVGDGEPADIDVFDPRYLPADVAQVINGMRQKGIDILAMSFSGRTLTADTGQDGAGEDGAGSDPRDLDEIRKSRYVYSADTFKTAMKRALAFIAQ